MKFELPDEISEYLTAREEYKKACNKVNTAKNKLSKHFRPLFTFHEAYKESFSVIPNEYAVMEYLGYRKKFYDRKPPYAYMEESWYKGEKEITRSEYYETISFISLLEIYNDGRIEENYSCSPLNKVPEEDKRRIKEFLLNEYLKIVNKEQTQ